MLGELDLLAAEVGQGEVSDATIRDRRAVIADWLTQPDNPIFARVAVNRIWAEVMGQGIVDPVDDFPLANPPSNARLLDALANDFVESGYDIRRLEKTILRAPFAGVLGMRRVSPGDYVAAVVMAR